MIPMGANMSMKMRLAKSHQPKHKGIAVGMLGDENYEGGTQVCVHWVAIALTFVSRSILAELSCVGHEPVLTQV